MDGPLALVARRADVLDLLSEGPIRKRDMPSYLDVSRSTVDRAVRRLEEAGLVEPTDGGYVVTPAGRVAFDRYRTLNREVEAVVSEREVLEPLPVDHDLPASLFDSGTVDLVDGPTPYRPVESVHDAIDEAASCRMYLPQMTDGRLSGCLRENAVDRATPTEIVAVSAVYEPLRSALSGPASSETTVLVGEGPQYALVLTVPADGGPDVAPGGDPSERRLDFHTGVGSPDARVAVTVVIFDERNRPHAVIRSDARDPVEWARRRYERIRASARPPDGVDGLADASESEGIREAEEADGE